MEKRYPITMMCAACIPWTDDFDFDEAKFRVHVKDLVDGGAKSIYIMGTAGEGYASRYRNIHKSSKGFS